MGGFGSGRQNGRPTVEAGFVLDINGLLRDRAIIPGQQKWGTLHWREVATEREMSALGFEADLVDPATAWVRLHYVIGAGEAQQILDYKVGLITTRPPRGGLRWWFRCPVSGRCCTKLHRPPGGDTFAARQAWGLGYHSQRVAPLERRRQAAHDRASRIRRRLGGEGSSFPYYADIPPRPKGMWRRTYKKLRKQGLEAEREAGQLFWEGAAAIVERADRAAGRRG